jgi:hypothetical protein
MNKLILVTAILATFSSYASEDHHSEGETPAPNTPVNNSNVSDITNNNSNIGTNTNNNALNTNITNSNTNENNNSAANTNNNTNTNTNNVNSANNNNSNSNSNSNSTSNTTNNSRNTSNSSNNTKASSSNSNGIDSHNVSTSNGSDLSKMVGYANAPALTTTFSETCMGSTSMGAGFAGGAVSLGSTWEDSACKNRLDAREARAMGDNEVAKEIFCGTETVRAAYKRVGRPCAIDGGSYTSSKQAVINKQSADRQELLYEAAMKQQSKL